MAGRTKPKRTRVVYTKTNPVQAAINACTLFTPAERAALLAPLQQAMHALRTAALTEWQFLQLATCAQVAMCIEDQRVVKGLRDHIKLAQGALIELSGRAMRSGTWRPPTCYGAEIEVIDTMLHLYAFQVGQLSAAEYRRAVALAKARQLTSGGRAVQIGEGGVAV